jgi:hypothetical protein
VQHLGDAVDGDVEEVAVVRDQDDGARVGDEELLEPRARFQVEVVRRLVEEQHVGALQQELRQRDAHLPAARQLAAVAVHVGVREPEAVQDGLGLRLDVVARAVLPLLADCGVALEQARVVVALRIDGREVVLHGLAPALELVQLRERGERVIEHAHPVDADDVLGQVADQRPARDRDLPVIGLERARDHLQQRRLAGPVRPREADARAVRDGPRHVVEDDLGAVSLTDARELQHRTAQNARRTPARQARKTLSSRRPRRRSAPRSLSADARRTT